MTPTTIHEDAVAEMVKRLRPLDSPHRASAMLAVLDELGDLGGIDPHDMEWLGNQITQRGWEKERRK